MRKAVILDRDGTIIKDIPYLSDPNRVEYLPYALEGLKSWHDAGFLLFVATNQSGISRGLVKPQELENIHQRIQSDCQKQGFQFAHFYHAPFAADSGHPFRKPNPGMLLKAAEDFQLDLKSSWMVGDRQTDVQAGIAAGTQTLFVKGTSPLPDKCSPIHIISNLKEGFEVTFRG